MKKPYHSIKSEVLAKLESHLPEIQERFGIESLGVFGSVSRGEDTPESDVDILYRFKPGIKTYHALLDLGEYLEKLFGRKVDLVSSEWMSPYLRPYVDAEVILYGRKRGAV
ncbi:nucleotidyltransferase family protein [Methanoplanus sp. FWC-SCC4]|uniref:protein adenylyltransferase n=1 Tax=Methanochimaera problematica TaxID=2609417 RepID=A0AA97FF58_9EURY|nr:nucleotidyltransferase family protein [Methanoplanus sp. FWC-SCC4]WOF17059.1 nucleotidyltransferase family protein [Methanoplanus sp. FWC-SCC4]